METKPKLYNENDWAMFSALMTAGSLKAADAEDIGAQFQSPLSKALKNSQQDERESSSLSDESDQAVRRLHAEMRKALGGASR